jgi:hypothetical protein
VLPSHFRAVSFIVSLKGSRMKSSYLVVYDYETGGVWGLIRANSKEEISRKYPRLVILDERPSWMSDADYRNIEAKMKFDIDDPPPAWLK